MTETLDDRGAAYAIENFIETASGRLELRHYGNVPDGEVTASEVQPSVGMVISSGPIYARYPAAHGLRDYRNVGSMVFRPRAVPWQVQTDGSAIHSLVCMFDNALFDRIVGRGDLWRPEELRQSLHLRCASIAHDLRSLEREVRTPGFASDVLAEGLTTSLAVKLARHLVPGRPARPGRKSAMLDGRQLRRIDDYLAGLSGRQPSIHELAGLCALPGRRLMRAFRQTTGHPLSAHIADVQHTKACSLLKDTSLSLKEISFRLGFSNHSNFTNAFRRISGEAPSEYRRRHR